MAPKICELLKSSSSYHNFSIEVSPGLNAEQICNLKHKPLFVSVTWHSKTNLCEGFDVKSMVLAEELSNRKFNVLLHISCDLLRRDYLNVLLEKLKIIDIRNIFAIQGDNYDSTSSDFPFAKDLVAYIKEKSDNWFCVGVAGYPNCDFRGLQHLKQKQDSGADFIITQAFFDPHTYLDFVKRCRTVGITLHIVAGVLLFEREQQLRSFAKLCKVDITEDMCKCMGRSDEAIGEKVAKKIIDELAGKHISFHYFSLNKMKLVSDFIDTILKGKI